VRIILEALRLTKDRGSAEQGLGVPYWVKNGVKKNGSADVGREREQRREKGIFF